MIDKLLDLRDKLTRRRDRIDAQIELLDQLVALEEGDDGQVDQESETQDGTEELPPSDAPPSSGRVPRSPRAAQAAAKPRKVTPLKPVKKRKVIVRRPEPDIGPTDIGKGKKEVKKGSNMEKVVDSIRCRAPHWMTHDGMVESAKALGVTVPKTFKAITHQECITLRKCDHAVPGLQYRKAGRRMEYRILADGHELAEEEG